jgi:hypothetical protein
MSFSGAILQRGQVAVKARTAMLQILGADLPRF